MVDRVEACRIRAEQCEAAARKAADERIRDVYQDMAQQWRDLAEQAERINRLMEGRNPLLRS